MKIALIGAQGVGKTTLSHRLLREFPGSILVKETVRECPYPCDHGADFKTEWWVLSHSILAEQEAREKKSELVITDRCLLDIAVYTKLIEQSGDGRISTLQRRIIEDVIDQWFRESPYDAIFFVKVSPDIWKGRDLDDGFRSTDAAWYEVLTAQFEEAIDRFEMRKRTKLCTVMNDGAFETTFESVRREILSLAGRAKNA